MFNMFAACCVVPQEEAPLRSSSSPPNSTGSTADSDSWDSQQRLSGTFTSPSPSPVLSLPGQSRLSSSGRKSFAGFKRGGDAEASCRYPPSQLHTRPKSAGLLLEGRRKTDKLLLKKKKKKKPQSRPAEEELRHLKPVFSSPCDFVVSSGRVIKEEPEEFLSIPQPAASSHMRPRSPEHHHMQSIHAGGHSPPHEEGFMCKQESDFAQGSPSWNGKQSPEHEHDSQPQLSDGKALVAEMEGMEGTRTVFRQGKQVVFRDQDGSGDDEDIMVDSGMLYIN